MISEIFIENRRLDLTGDISSLLTFAIDDIKDFASRNTTFSKTIVLPGTANNNYLFGHIFDARISNPYDELSDNVATNFNASVGAQCIMFQDNIQVFKGTMRLLEIVITDKVPEYEVAVFGELGGLVAALGNGKLEDLDFSAYNHTYNVTNIQNSWDNTPGSGYFYPLIDIGTVSAAKVDYDVKAFRPALYVREYIDKIFAAAGYRFESALMDTDRFKRLIVPFGLKKLTVENTVYIDVEADGTQTIDAPTSTKIFFPNTNTIDNFTPSDANQHTFNYDDPTTINPLITLNVSGEYSANVPLLIAIYRLRGAGPQEVLASVYLTTATSGVFNKTLLVAAEILQNDDIYCRITGVTVNNGARADILYARLIVAPQSGETVEISYGDMLSMNLTLPKNILQKDFLSSIIKLFNLYLYEDVNQTKKVYMEPYVDFYDLNVSGVVDWDYKVDRNRPVRIKPMSELNSRYYNFKLKQDNDFYNEDYRKRYSETYGDRIYDSEFEFTNEKTDIEVIFSPTILVGYQGADKVVSVTYKKNASVEERTDVNIRILQTKKVTGVASWSIKNSTTVLVSGLTSYGYGGHYDDPDAPANDIHFGVPRELFFTLATGAINVTQFNVYWSPYMAEVTDKDSKLMTCYMKLSNKDIYDLNFGKFIHVDGSYWRLNKIEDWNASEPDVCKVELLKLINMIY